MGFSLFPFCFEWFNVLILKIFAIFENLLFLVCGSAIVTNIVFIGITNRMQKRDRMHNAHIQWPNRFECIEFSWFFIVFFCIFFVYLRFY